MMGHEVHIAETFQRRLYAWDGISSSHTMRQLIEGIVAKGKLTGLSWQIFSGREVSKGERTVCDG